MMNVAGIIADQNKYLPTHTQQVIEFEFEFFLYNGGNYGYYYLTSSQNYGSAKNVSDDYNLNYFSDVSMQAAKRETGTTGAFSQLSLIPSMRYNVYIDGAKIRFEHYAAYGGTTPNIDFSEDPAFLRVENKYGFLQRSPNGKAVTENDDAVKIFDSSPSMLIAGANDYDPTPGIGRNCNNPYYCIQTRLEFFDAPMVSKMAESYSLGSGTSETVRVYFAGTADYD